MARGRDSWTAGKKFMLAPFNLIGTTGFKDALLGATPTSSVAANTIFSNLLVALGLPGF